MGEALLQLVETEPVEEKALTIADQAKAVKVFDSATYTAAGVLWKSIGDMIKEVKETFDPICDATHKAHDAATKKRSKYLDPLTAAYKSVKGLMSAYDQQQEAIRQAEQRRLEEIARKEEAERRRVELERLEAERKAEAERLLEAAAAAEKAGNNDQAEELVSEAIIVNSDAVMEAAAIQAEPVYVPPVVIPRAVPKMAGGPVYRTVTKFRIDNAALIPRQYLVPDMVKIGGVVRALKQAANIPGITVYEERC